MTAFFCILSDPLSTHHPITESYTAAEIGSLIKLTVYSHDADYDGAILHHSYILFSCFV